jgi:hypothetical protein
MSTLEKKDKHDKQMNMIKQVLLNQNKIKRMIANQQKRQPTICLPDLQIMSRNISLSNSDEDNVS